MPRYRKLVPAAATLALAGSLGAQRATVRPPMSEWTAVYELSAKMDVAINPDRLLHGPAAAVAPNGDWLVSFQDSADHSGRDGVVSQVRSRDRGRTWSAPAVVYDGRNNGDFGRNPAYGVTQDGRVVLVVQRWRAPAAGVKPTLQNEGIVGSVYLVSDDNGLTYLHKGLVDPEAPLRHQGSSSAIIRVGATLYMTALAVNASPPGITLYRTDDPGKGWRFAGYVLRTSDLPVDWISYPSIVQRKDGSLLVNCVNFCRNFQTVSQDGGQTWSAPREVMDLRIRNNPDLDYAGGVLVAHGRGEEGNSVWLYFSPDEGLTWGSHIVLDRHGFRGWGGYSASLRTPDGGLFVVFSTDAGPRTGHKGGKPDIRGVLLTDVEVRRK